MRICLLFLVLLMNRTEAAAQADPSAHYRIFDTRKQQETGVDAVLRAWDKADVLFFGESHGDSVGHLLQQQILREGYKRYGQSLVLSLEMFQTDVQLVLDEYLKGVIREKNLMQDARPWKSYKDYRPMVEFARENGIYVVAANAPSRYTNMVTAGGLQALEQLDSRARSLLAPFPFDTATGRYHEKFLEAMGGHSMGGMQLFQSQNLWDATMAWSVFRAWSGGSGRKIFHCNGRFHTDEGLGTAARLSEYASREGKKLRALRISSFPDSAFRATDLKQYSNLADFVILTEPLGKTE